MNLGPIKGSAIFGFIVIVGLVVGGYFIKQNTDAITKLQAKPVMKSVPTVAVVTPTDVPTATPSAQPVIKTRIGTPAAATVTKAVIK